jgi:tctex1 domain-containing protein 2
MTTTAPEFQIRPTYNERFPSSTVKEVVRDILKTELTGIEYTVDSTPDQSKRIADTVRNKLRELKLPRYKFMVQVVIGELRGQGVQMGSRCFWDSSSDCQVSETFVNDSLFAVCTAFGVYYN